MKSRGSFFVPRRWRGRELVSRAGAGAVLALALGGGGPAARAQEFQPPRAKVGSVSQSGQFIIHGVGYELPKAAPGFRPVGGGQLVELRPELLAVTCERVRKVVNLRLGYSDRAGTKVHVFLHERRPAEGRLDIELLPYGDGWQMSLRAPASVEWPRLLRALVEIVLLDHACAGGRAAQAPVLPLWLPEGLDALIEAEFGRDLVVESQTTLNRTQLRGDPLEPARKALAGGNPMSFSELSNINEAELSNTLTFDRFRATSTLLVSTLLSNRDGQGFSRGFLSRLSGVLNWQTAFLAASEGRFATLLDVERWWAVTAADSLSHDPALLWPRDRVVRELWEVATEAADVRSATNAPAQRRTYLLSELVDAWPFGEQRPVLERKAAQLRVLSSHTPAGLFPLVAEYYRTVAGYLDEREAAGRNPESRMVLEGRAPMVAAVFRRRLSDLERRLQRAAPPPR